ncbi:MAG TPA: RecX family transcriptional regulator [Anaerolineae bacterium]|nr:RecX family transcriptional regulator [Anaerolineae bacterium]
MEKVITSIEGQKRDRQRVNVYLDDKFAFGISRFVAARLKVGQSLSEEMINQLRVDDSIESAYQKSLRYLSYRPRSEYEVRKRVSEYGFDDSVIEKVIARLIDKQYLGDKWFANEWVENRIVFRPRSRFMLRYELRQKRVLDDIITDVLQSIPQESELAERAARKYFNRLKDLPRQTFQKKLRGYLSRRGFSYTVVKSTTDKIWKEMDE